MAEPDRETSALTVWCTCPDRAVAEQLAGAAVEAGLAACVNILPQVRSVYVWEGEIQTDDELLLIAKTTTARFRQLEALWTARHPYELPEVIAVPIANGSAPYLAWISSNTTSSS